jgi:nucleoside-diphosphate-sugar epimerase
LTSSFGAIGYGHKPTEVPFTEETWTDTTYKGISAYVKSKTLAEKAAWDFIRNEGGNLELSVINPTGIFGPLLGSNVTSSLQIIQQLMNGTLKATPQMNFGIVDVRDVADAHRKILGWQPRTNEEAIVASAESVMRLSLEKEM